jgi:signal transduction histidine kinase/FixJ family two-component response regulator
MRRNVLIIDDDVGTCETLSDVLKEVGYTVASARNALLGLDYVKRGGFSVALVDIKLPDMDGLDLVQRMLVIQPKMYVVIITGHASLENVIRAMNSKAYAYLCKPFEMEDLKATISKAFKQVEFTEKQRLLEQEIREVKERLDETLNSLPGSVVLFDRDQKVEYVNAVYLREFSKKKEEVLGKSLLDQLPVSPAEKERVKENLEVFFGAKIARSAEIRVGTRFVRYKIFPFSKRKGERAKAGLVLWDVTEEKKLQAYLAQSEKLAGIGLIVTGIAHEINNPLQGIMGMAEAITAEEEINVVKGYARELISYTKDVSDIVKSLISYSREAKETELIHVGVDVKLKDALRISRHSVEFKEIEVIITDEDAPKIRVNPGELQQVFVNIINNAVQAMEGKGRLTLSTGSADGHVIVRISDTGPGISKEHLGKIFDPFFTTKEIGRGTGLGLNIAYRIVAKYLGKIEVESEEGKGATFIIKLPIV